MTKEEIRLKAVDNAKEYEVWPPAADYQDGLIKGFEDGAEWMLDNLTGGALLYAVVKTAERTKREMIEKAADWLSSNMFNSINNGVQINGTCVSDFIERLKQAMQDEGK
jgi:hypothetical protein